MSRLDKLKEVVGDLARPFSIYSSAAATAWAVIDPGTGSDKLTAAGLILAGLYGAKTIERREEVKQSANVEVARVQAGLPTEAPQPLAAPAAMAAPAPAPGPDFRDTPAPAEPQSLRSPPADGPEED